MKKYIILALVLSITSYAEHIISIPNYGRIPKSLNKYFECSYNDDLNGNQCRKKKVEECKLDYELFCNNNNLKSLKNQFIDPEYNMNPSKYCNDFKEICSYITEYKFHLTDDDVFNTKKYFDCEDEELCKYACKRSVRKCWNSQGDYKPQDCWNLELACNSISSGKIPELIDIEIPASGIKLNLSNPETPIGEKIPKSLVHCIIKDNNTNDSGSLCLLHYNNCSSNDNKEMMNKKISDSDMKDLFDEELQDYTLQDFCTLHAEICHMLSIYREPLSKEYVYNHNRYFGCEKVEECQKQCDTSVKCCYDDDFPEQDCKNLEIVCKSISSGIIPTFSSSIDSSVTTVSSSSIKIIPTTSVTVITIPTSSTNTISSKKINKKVDISKIKEY